MEGTSCPKNIYDIRKFVLHEIKPCCLNIQGPKSDFGLDPHENFECTINLHFLWQLFWHPTSHMGDAGLAPWRPLETFRAVWWFCTKVIFEVGFLILGSSHQFWYPSTYMGDDIVMPWSLKVSGWGEVLWSDKFLNSSGVIDLDWWTWDSWTAPFEIWAGFDDIYIAERFESRCFASIVGDPSPGVGRPD